MATSPLLARLLNTPDLPGIVPRLPAEVLIRVIDACGLEDAAELVALCTPQQLSRVLDVDVWRGRTPGGDEEFDAERFGLWLEVLMQSGPEAAAAKIIGLDPELVVAGFSRHAAVFDYAAVASYTTLDGEEVTPRGPNAVPTAEIGGYLVEARQTSAWETIVELLACLHAVHAGYFHRLMRGCVRLSSGPREADGLDTLLGEFEQDMFDLASDREGRREQQGFVTPAQARALLEAARHVPLDGAQPPQSPLARAYFRELESNAPAPGAEPARPFGLLPESQADHQGEAESSGMAEVVEVLREAGVLTEPRALLPPAADGAVRLALIQDHVASHPESLLELAYLANAIVAGCSIQGRPFAPQEASTAAAAICNLGLESWPPHWSDGDLVGAFQVGWTVLHRDVSMFVAQGLLAVLEEIRYHDHDIDTGLDDLRHALMKSIREATPWQARGALEVLMMLDAPSWAALAALTGECPVLHGAIGASERREHTIDPVHYEFISQRSQIVAVREFMESLLARLSP